MRKIILLAIFIAPQILWGQALPRYGRMDSLRLKVDQLDSIANPTKPPGGRLYLFGKGRLGIFTIDCLGNVVRIDSTGTWLSPSDSTSIRNYSNSLYLKNADSTTLKNSLLKNADSTTLKNSLLKNADSTSIRNYSNSLYVAKYTDSLRIGPAMFPSPTTADTIPIYIWQSGLSIAAFEAQIVNGTSDSINVLRDRSGTIVRTKATSLFVSSVTGYPGAFSTANADQNQSLLIGDILLIVINAPSGSPKNIAVQLILTKSR